METENFKELEKVIMRDDYKRLTEQLAKKCKVLANIIMDKMLELDIKELDDLIIEEEQSYHGFKVEYLVIKKVNKDKCWIKYASNDEALYFLNKAKNYLRLLDDIETKKCEQIENALKNI